MDPTASELASFKVIGDIFTWLELEPFQVTALTAAVGSAPRLLSWARIPETRFRLSVSALRVKPDDEEERILTPMEEGQVGEVCRIARLALAAAAKGPPPSLGQDTRQRQLCWRRRGNCQI